MTPTNQDKTAGIQVQRIKRKLLNLIDLREIQLWDEVDEASNLRAEVRSEQAFSSTGATAPGKGSFTGYYRTPSKTECKYPPMHVHLRTFEISVFRFLHQKRILYYIVIWPAPQSV